jgi:hypothetical protein
VSTAAAGVLLAFAVLATLAPWRRPGWRRPAIGLVLEAVVLAVAVGLALYLRRGHADSLAGRATLLVAAYWYACAGGIAIVRLVLGLVPVTEQAGAGGIVVTRAELAPGRIIGVLDRAIALTLVLWGEFGAPSAWWWPPRPWPAFAGSRSATSRSTS